MSKRYGGVLPALVYLLIAVGCQGGDDVVVIGGDPLIVVHNFSGGHAVLFTGKVEYDSRSKCILLRGRGMITGKEWRTVPVWPAGTSPMVDRGRRGVDVRGLGAVLEGETISIGGSRVGAEEFRPEIDVPAECRRHGFTVITPDMVSRGVPSDKTR